jgi:hypothetical protein
MMKTMLCISALAFAILGVQAQAESTMPEQTPRFKVACGDRPGAPTLILVENSTFGPDQVLFRMTGDPVPQHVPIKELKQSADATEIKFDASSSFMPDSKFELILRVGADGNGTLSYGQFGGFHTLVCKQRSDIEPLPAVTFGNL